ncbi:hypothetical protein MTO96_044734, partial [Rhipicephalus appendiculatus]
LCWWMRSVFLWVLVGVVEKPAGVVNAAFRRQFDAAENPAYGCTDVSEEATHKKNDPFV